MSANAERDWLAEATGSRPIEFYEMIGIGLSDNGSGEAAVRCFANPGSHTRDDRRPSCSVNLLTGLWHCKGCSASGNAYHAAKLMGRDDTQARDLAREYGVFIEKQEPREKPKLPGERQLKKWRQALADSPKIVARLTELRAWTPYGMCRCGLGWDGERVTFPVRNHRLKIVGVVRYLPGGRTKSLALSGSKRMLFPAPEVTNRRRTLFVVEGEPDAVAVWSTGQQAVAIPGTGSWRSDWMTRLMGRRVVVLADCDPQGRELARKVARDVPQARWVDLEPGRDDGYDIGDIVREAAGEGGLRQVHDLLERLAA